MYMLRDLIQQCRNLTGDTSVTPDLADTILTDFINRAINDVSLHFPREIALTLTTSAGVHSYTLPVGVLQILSVEYPAGGSAFAGRLAQADPAFWLSAGYYDWSCPEDSSDLNPPTLTLSANPADDEEIHVVYAAEHAQLAAATDICSLPDRLIHLIGLFVRWKCWQQLATREAMDPDPLHVLAGTQEANAARAEQAYRRALADAKAAAAASRTARWKMDKHDRIY